MKVKSDIVISLFLIPSFMKGILALCLILNGTLMKWKVYALKVLI